MDYIVVYLYLGYYKYILPVSGTLGSKTLVLSEALAVVRSMAVQNGQAQVGLS